MTIADLVVLNTDVSKTDVSKTDSSEPASRRTDSLTRAALPLVLTGFTVTGSFPTIEAMLTARPQADIALLEVGDDGRRAEDSVRLLARAGYRVCLYTFEYRPAIIARYVAAGARCVVSKADSVNLLARALARTAAGGTAISEEFQAASAGSAHPVRLTARQLQILAGRARSETFHSIARRLEISERTAQDHWSAIARRFETFLRSHSPADLERSLGLDNGVAHLE